MQLAGKHGRRRAELRFPSLSFPRTRAKLKLSLLKLSATVRPQLITKSIQLCGLQNERIRQSPQPLLLRVHVDLLGDFLRLDLLVLSGDEHVARRLCRLLPPVLGDPLVDGVLVDESELLAERLVEDVLVRDGDDVADELPTILWKMGL